jgi:carboxynorspermidine decarboxylase
LAGDQVGIYAFEKPLQTGDDLVFMDMMHYTMVKTNTFNGMELPSIGLWRSNRGFELIRRFGYEDFESRLS